MRTRQPVNVPLLLIFSAAALALLVFWPRREASRATPPRPVAGEPAPVSAGRDQELQKFSLTGFDESGKHFWNLEGETARIDSAETVLLEQGVTLRLRDDTVIETDRLRWSQDRGTLRTDAPVRVRHQSADVKGRGAYGRPNENFIQLNRDIVMVLAGPDGKPTTVTCSGPLKIHYNENRMVFYRNVKVVDGRGVLTADRMDVRFDGDKKQVTEILAAGSVVIERGTDTTRSQRAIYNPVTGSIRLEGSPEILLHKGASNILDGAARN